MNDMSEDDLMTFFVISFVCPCVSYWLHVFCAIGVWLLQYSLSVLHINCEDKKENCFDY